MDIGCRRQFGVFPGIFLTCLLMLTVSGDLSAQPQVGSQENPRDCLGIDFGTARDVGCGCAKPGPVCGKCGYNMTACEQQLGCGTTPDVGCGCGRGTSCYGCDGVPYSGKTNLGCGCGNGRSCYGCDGVANSGKVDSGCGCGAPGKVCGSCGGTVTKCGDCNTTCCEATVGNICINFGFYETMRFAPNLTTIQGFYSHWGSSHNFVNKEYAWCQQGDRICGGMRCYESGGVALLDSQANAAQAWAACPLSNHGCFDPSATILLEGGKLVAARDVKLGDRIFNSLSGRSFAVKRVLVGPENLPMVEMGFNGHLLRVTQEHPILTADGMKRANQVKVGDRILDAAGNEQELQYVRLAELVDGQKVVNFELDVDSSDPIDRLIVADNMTSGDLAVQQSKLPGEE